MARNLYGTGTFNCEEKEEDSEPESTRDSETETESELEGSERQGSVPRVLAIPLQNGGSGGRSSRPCTSDDPSKRCLFYKKRLKAAIKLVDAENCSPPPEMMCTQGCLRIRPRMCETHRTQSGNSTPCHNGMCCVWREIDTHIVRCQNSQCEFKNAVGLRQTMHVIQQHEMKLETTKKKLQATKNALLGEGDECSRSHLENKIERLENKCTKLEDAILLHKDRERAFKMDLNILKVDFSNDEAEELPSFQSHYARIRSQDRKSVV